MRASRSRSGRRSHPDEPASAIGALFRVVTPDPAIGFIACKMRMSMHRAARSGSLHRASRRMTMPEILALTFGAFSGAMVSGFSGFAFSAVCGAVVLHFLEPQRAVPVMMGCSIASQAIAMVLLRRSLRFQANPWLLLGGMSGVTVAVFVVSVLDPRAMRWFFGAFLALYAAYLMFRTPIRLQSMSGAVSQVFVGTLGGAVGVLTAMPGAIPMVWCEMRGCSKEEQRACVQPFIMAMQMFALILLAAAPGGISWEVPYYLAISFPALVLGSLLGVVVFRRINDEMFRKLVLLMLAVSGFMLLR